MISVFDLFSIGIGPSSSHTVGPMRAAYQFATLLDENGLDIGSITVQLYGSLALTGKGHGTDVAVLLGLEGNHPELVDPATIESRITRINESKTMNLLGKTPVPYSDKIIQFKRFKSLPFHPNAMVFVASDVQGNEIMSKTYYSIGGGFVHEDGVEDEIVAPEIPHFFESAVGLMEQCSEKGISIEELMWARECTKRSEFEIDDGLMAIWQVMQDCVRAGCKNEGILPGGLEVKRRAPEMHRTLSENEHGDDPAAIMDWASLYALAVNEENAAMGRVVTAPTNGAAGIIPSVLHCYHRYYGKVGKSELRTFFLTAAAIGILYKRGASISGAEMGCQGEVGVACSMAAAGLAALWGGTVSQIENAAEIGMEHHLGLTCDPVKGLVQIPCIERNTMGSIKAINAARLALKQHDAHKVSLDKVIKTMRQTGEDMKKRYKETSEGGLAINVIEC